jgi:large subunit ribosomal protein L3
MAGRWGADNVTTRNLEIVAVRADENLLLVRGAVPGSRNGTVIVRRPKARQTADSGAEAKS